MVASFGDHEGFEAFRYTVADGLVLAGRKYGFDNRGAFPVICLAGLTRNSADFHELALHLAHGASIRRPVLALDYRGRGASARDRNWRNYNVLTEAEDLIAGAVAASVNEAVFIGTSRGALITMVLAAMRPGMIAGAVMNDAGPEIDARGLLRIKGYIENGSDYRNWTQAAAALKAAGSNHFPAWDHAMWEKQARRLFVEQKGQIIRNYDPALINTFRDLDIDRPVPSLWPQFKGLTKVPVLVIRGELSDLLSTEAVARMDAMHPRLETITVPGQGHAPDLGTAGLPERIAEFISRIGH
jgi:pimeloyl-ACP methyl ester carboxylesterase